MGLLPFHPLAITSNNVLASLHTRAYVKRRGSCRKGVNMDVILSPLSLMAASLLTLVRGIAISTIIMQAVIAAVMWQASISSSRRLLHAHGIVLHTPFLKQVSVSGEDYLCVAELCVSEF